MRTSLVIALLLTTLAANARAELANPSGPPPQHMRAQLHHGMLILTERLESYTTVYKTVKYEENGVAKERQIAASQPISTTVERAVGANDYRIFDLAGKQLSAEAAAERLAESTTVLTSAHGSKVDPLYLQLYKPDTLIIYLRPSPVAPYPAMAHPAPLAAPAPNSPPPASGPPVNRPPPSPLPPAL